MKPKRQEDPSCVFAYRFCRGTCHRRDTAEKRSFVKAVGTIRQENLGHATAAFTLDVYGHVTTQMKQDSAQRMEQFIQSVSNG